MEIFGSSVSPQIIWKNETDTIVYEYVEGSELLKVQITNRLKKKIKQTLDSIHEIGKLKLQPSPEEVTKYYERIYQKFSSSENNYPSNLLDAFQKLIEEQPRLLVKYQDNITYVHGDLVPPNIIVKENINLIDWEFYRPELSFFDFVYLNYYSKAHNLPISFKVNFEINDFYFRLVDTLEQLWSYGYKLKNKVDFKIKTKTS